LAQESEKLAERIPQAFQDAYFQLVQFPIQGAEILNERNLSAFQSRQLAKLNIPAANDWDDRSNAADVRLTDLVRRYNLDVSGGKWNKMMSLPFGCKSAKGRRVSSSGLNVFCNPE